METVKKWRISPEVVSDDIIAVFEKMFNDENHCYPGATKEETENILVDKISKFIGGQISGLDGMSDDDFEYNIRKEIKTIFSSLWSEWTKQIQTRIQEGKNAMRVPLTTIVITSLECEEWTDWEEYFEARPNSLDDLAQYALTKFISAHGTEVHDKVNAMR